MEYYIYYLECDNEIFYIGKTNKPNERLRKHKSTSKLKRTYKENFIFKRLNECKTINLKIIETVEFDKQDEREIYWIDYYKSLGINLCNATSGGEGGDFWSGRKHSEETKQKLHNIAIEKGYQFKRLIGEENGRSKLKEEDVLNLRRLREEGLSYGQLSIKFGISKTSVIDIVKRRLWKHI